MNNPRLLAGMLCASLLSAGVCAYASSPRVVTLDEIFECAESNSAQLRPYFTAEEEAQAGISVARASRLPDITANASASYIGNGFVTKRDFSHYEVAKIPHLGYGFGVTLEQPVYTGGAISTGIEMAELQSTAARYATELNRDNIRFQLTGLYLDLYKYSNLRRVVESNVAQARQVLEEMHARYEQGTALRNDITRYELLVSNLELQLIKINNLLEILNRNLVTTAGLPESTIVEPDSTILSRSLEVSGEGSWQEAAQDNAPSLALARTGITLSEKAERMAKADRLPKIGIRAGWTLDGPILVEIPPLNLNLSYWYVGVGISYNLASLYKSNKSVKRAQIASQKAREDYDAALQHTSLAINSDYVHYLEAYEELKTQQKSVELAERNYNTTSTRYSADMALITDMLDAANSKLDAEQQLVNARINIIYYYYKLLFTSGKL